MTIEKLKKISANNNRKQMTDHLTLVQVFAFNIFIFVSYATYFLLLAGVLTKEPSYLSALDFYARLYVCLFLVYRFNPLRKKVPFNYLDRKIVFTSALFLLTITISNTIASTYLDKVKTEVKTNISKTKNEIKKIFSTL